jgi:hypothetical protein
MFKYAKDYARTCDVCQRVGNPSHVGMSFPYIMFGHFKILKNGKLTS